MLLLYFAVYPRFWLRGALPHGRPLESPSIPGNRLTRYSALMYEIGSPFVVVAESCSKRTRTPHLQPMALSARRRNKLPVMNVTSHSKGPALWPYLLFALTTSVMAQQDAGSIQGTVTDPEPASCWAITDVVRANSK